MKSSSDIKKALITGSNGILGHALVTALRSRIHITGFDLSNNVVEEIDFVGGDITKKSEIRDAVKRVQPDVVVHCAAFTDVDGCELKKGLAFQVNGEGTKNVLLAAQETGSLLVYISTDYVFDGTKSSAYFEDDKPCPINTYGESKYLGEKYVCEGRAPFLIVRTSWLYGLRGKNFVDTILLKVKSEKTLKVVQDQVGRPTYAKDLASAMVAVILDKSNRMQKIKNSIVHIANRGAVSWFEFAQEILRITGHKEVTLHGVDSAQVKRPARRPNNSVLDTDKFEKLFPGILRTWDIALKEYIEEKNLA